MQAILFDAAFIGACSLAISVKGHTVPLSTIALADSMYFSRSPGFDADRAKSSFRTSAKASATSGAPMVTASRIQRHARSAANLSSTERGIVFEICFGIGCWLLVTHSH